MPGMGGMGGGMVGASKTPGKKVQGGNTLYSKVMGGGGDKKKSGDGGGKAKAASSSSTWSDLQTQFSPRALPSSYHKGGKVRRGGWAKLKKGEIVLSAAQSRVFTGKTAKRTGKRAASKRYAK